MGRSTSGAGVTPEGSQAAERVREAERRLSEVERITHTGSWEWDLVRDRILWSEEQYRIFGLEVGEPVDFDRYLELLHPADRARVQETVENALEKRGEFEFQHRIVRPDREVRLVHARGEVMTGSRGEPVRMMGTVQDVTRAAEAGQERERRVREEAARTAAEEGERRARFLAEAGRILSSSLDYETTLRNVADLAVREMADWCAVDLAPGLAGETKRVGVAHRDPERMRMAEGLQERYPPRDDAEVGAPAVIRSGEPQLIPEIPPGLLEEAAHDEEHLRVLRKLGLRSLMVVPLRGREAVLGAITFVSAESGRRFDQADLAQAEDLASRAAQAIENALLFRQVSEARDDLEAQASEMEAQAELLETQAAEMEEVQGELEASRDDLLMANRELEERTLEAERARDEAETANASKAAFLAAMSHELRTPLNAIGGYVELVEMEVYGPVTQKQRRALERVRRSQRLLLALINDILNFAKIEAGSLEYNIEPVPLRPLLREMCTVMRPQLKAKGLGFTLDEGSDEIAALADREKMEQIVLNLIGNAVKFTPKGGEITVSSSADGDVCTISVRDTGRGIPADQMKEIFEAFVQVDRNLAERSEGVGLGLSISQNLAHAMGGELHAESEMGKGSTFELRLPRAS